MRRITCTIHVLQHEGEISVPLVFSTVVSTGPSISGSSGTRSRFSFVARLLQQPSRDILSRETLGSRTSTWY
jgi:hypothetical protein